LSYFDSERDLSGISADIIYKRLVSEGRGLGSHCCGLNTLLLHVLLGLGYRAFAGLGQFNRAPLSSSDVILGPRTHMVLFVQTPCSPQVYLVDAGGGTVGLVKPIPMCDGEIVQGASMPEEHRLVRIPRLSSVTELPSRCNDWKLEIRCGTHIPVWRVLFTFSSQPVDSTAIEVANQLLLGPQGDPTFRDDIFCVKYFRLDFGESESRAEDHCETAEDFGRLVLTGGKVTRRIGDRCEVLSTLRTEEDRRTALNDVFGVKIDFSKTFERHPLCSFGRNLI